MEAVHGNSNLETKKGKRLILFPAPLQGHINPVIQLANILHAKGFDIIIVHTKFNSIDQSKYPHFTFHSIQDGLLEHEASTSDVVDLMIKLNGNCVQPFGECLANLLSDGQTKPVISCLIIDSFWYFTRELGDRFKLPILAFRTVSVCSALAFNSLLLFQKLGYLSKPDSELEEEIPEFPPLRMKDIPVIKSRYPDGIFKLISSILESNRAASGLIFNSFRELEEPALTKISQECQSPTFAIGPFLKYFPASPSSLMEPDQSAIHWLNKQAPKSVIYVSFGSTVHLNEAQMSEVASVIANSVRPFLWVVRPGLVRNSFRVENLLNGFLEAVNRRVHIVNWAPQQEVLAHPAIGGFWTHSGWNSTLESICEGVPMICSPFYGDQLINSRFVNDVWKIGLRVEKGLVKGEIERVIERLMDEKEGKEIRERVLSYKEKINACTEEGGSSQQSLQGLIDRILSF
ncbi:OLC1v1026671C1 [Oldenlandia corymbosa var. corymbosa]|uniref:OLC1v1026671C1 n=1 Tax=Oldenlandia corymbosa var. corymbosa TaxID=529605 RepID=A0AAV1CAD4_OLDCO|nr:OLC1v1026671C1 [Oldenlandia corymbosa var. corymbosa]